MKIKIKGIVKVSRETKKILPCTFGLVGFDPITGILFLDIFVDTTNQPTPICRFFEDTFVRLVEPVDKPSFYVAKVTQATTTLSLRQAVTEALVKKGIAENYSFK